MFLQPRRNLFRCAIGDQGVYQLVAAGLDQIIRAAGEPLQHGQVVGQAQVEVQGLAAQGAGLVRVGGEDHLLFRHNDRSWPQKFTCPTGMRRRREVGVCQRRTLRRQLQRLLRERGQGPALLRDAGLVQHVEVFDQPAVRLVDDATVDLGMSGADAQDETPGMRLLDPLP